jgi:hypothetical protein
MTTEKRSASVRGLERMSLPLSAHDYGKFSTLWDEIFIPLAKPGRFP